MCQPSMNSVLVSTTCQAERTKSRRLRSASSRSISLARNGFDSNCSELAQFIVTQLAKVRSRRDPDRASCRAAVLGVEEIAIAEQVLRQENVRGRIACVCDLPETAPQGYPALCLAAVHHVVELD